MLTVGQTRALAMPVAVPVAWPPGAPRTPSTLSRASLSTSSAEPPHDTSPSPAPRSPPEARRCRTVRPPQTHGPPLYQHACRPSRGCLRASCTTSASPRSTALPHGPRLATCPETPEPPELPPTTSPVAPAAQRIRISLHSLQHLHRLRNPRRSPLIPSAFRLAPLLLGLATPAREPR